MTTRQQRKLQDAEAAAKVQQQQQQQQRPVYVDTPCAVKAENNAAFAAAVQAHLVHSSRASQGCRTRQASRASAQQQQQLRVMVLDGPRLETTRTLNAALACCPPAIVAPQRDAAAAAEMRSQAPANLEVVSTSIAEALGVGAPTPRGPQFDAAYLDYMNTVSGCSKTGDYPLEDIALFLRRCRGRKVVLCLTFARRMRIGVYAGRRSATDAIVNDFLAPLFQHAGFRALDIATREYRRGSSSNSRRSSRRRSSSSSAAPMVFVTAVLQYDAALLRSRHLVRFALTRDRCRFEGYH
jgi:hypothetical protein